MSKNVAMMLWVVAVVVGVPSLASALSPDPVPVNGASGSAIVPEPTAAALFGLGAALVAVRSRKPR